MMEFNGILSVNKDKGFTSHDVVAKLRRILKMKKIGHTGTLDPSVTGVLPICLGKATKVAEYLLDLPKTYEGQLTLGKATTTEDADGEITEMVRVSPLSIKDIEEAFACFEGEIEQIPPMYSAVKVEGKKLYELARQGKEIERQARKVNIYELEILRTDLEEPFPTVNFRVKCSKGTYVRTLCVDIGKKLGFPAHMSSLVRTVSGPFHLAESLTLEQIESAVAQGNLDEHISNIGRAVEHLPSIEVDAFIEQKVMNGQPIRNIAKIKQIDEEELYAVYSKNSGELLAIHQYDEKEAITKPVKVFS